MSSMIGSIVRGIEAPAFTGSEQQKLSAPPPSATAAADVQTMQQIAPPPARVAHSPEGDKVRDQGHSVGGGSQKDDGNPEIEIEERRFDFKDGQLTVKVYDRNGKLLREVPPGYVPLDLSA